jgi:6,7-dimethyl-8-ribityllumazine synthase
MASVKKNQRSRSSAAPAKVNRHRGALTAGKARFAIIVAQFNEYFTEKLLDGAIDTLTRHGVKPASIDVYYVPGSFELPLVVKRILAKRRADAVITLGMVIKGETRHFDHVVDESARGAMQASLESDIPVLHGVVSANDMKQAIDRAGGKVGNKGRDCARAAIEMVNLLKKI